MKIELDVKAALNRTINTCKKDEAFRIGESWYSKINVFDSEIKDVLDDEGDSFAEIHVLDICEGSLSDDLTACIHLTSMSFIYINKQTVPDEWASAKVVIAPL